MNDGTTDERYMRSALAMALWAEQAGEVPVGAVVVHGHEIIGSGWNQPIVRHDPSAHAEIIALRAAAEARGNYRLESATMYVTLEPCAMCTGALLNARIARVVFGAWDAKAGACGSVFDLPREPKLTHRLDVFGGVLRDDCSEVLQRFFRARRGT